MTELLEREGATEQLHAALASATAGRGGVVLVSGEAGMGKTSLVRDFIEHAAGPPITLRGACDPVESARPFGPLIDAARATCREVAADLASGLPRAAAFAAAVDMIDRPGHTTLFVIEDMHWADEATLDLFTFLARRIEPLHALLVVTFRSDEVDARHPLRLRLGDIHAHVLARVELRPLSIDAVRHLLDRSDHPALDAAEVVRVTGGNPFYVTEIIESVDGEHLVVPESVRDAVLARAARLPDEARGVLDAAAIEPGNIEPWLLHEVAREPGLDVASALDVCEEHGLVRRHEDTTIEFRHELARIAIEDALSPGRRRHLHALALDALVHAPGPRDHARLAHHAIAADHGTAVLEHAPIGADAAARAGSHRESALLLEAALTYEHLLDDGARGALWQRLGVSSGQLADGERALDAFTQAAEAFRAAGDVENQAISIASCDSAYWQLGRDAEVRECLVRADALLGDDPSPSPAAATVAAAWCAAYMLARESEAAEVAARRALALARAVDDPQLLSFVLIESGISLAMAGDDAGLDRIHHGIQTATENGDDINVILGHSQIGSGYGELRRYDIAIPALHTGSAFAREREYIGRQLYLEAWLARCELEVGDWDAAGARADETIRSPRCTGNIRLVTLLVLGWLRIRRGDPGASDLLDEALELAHSSKHLQRLWPAAACRAEHAWARGRLDDELSLVEDVLALAQALGYRPAIEELNHWLTVGDGRPRGRVEEARTAFGLSAAGRPDLAAARWREVGCPYERALAEYSTGTRVSLVDAHATFMDLGASPMRDLTAAALRELGERVPRGQNSSTRANPYGLTDRELEVLALLPSGMTNAEIGQALFISTKTAGNHVSNLLAKLSVGTRAEAAVVASHLDDE